MAPQKRKHYVAFLLLLYVLLPTLSNPGSVFQRRYLAFSSMEWPAVKSSKVLKALLHIGWRIKRQRGSHRILSRTGWPDVTFAFHEREEIGPKMLARVAKHTGLTPGDF